MLNNIKSQYEKLEQPASDLLWEKLEKKLDKDQSEKLIPNQEIATQPFEKKLVRYAAAAVLLLTLGNIIWMLRPKEKEQNVIVKEIVKTKIVPVKANEILQEQPKNNQSLEQNLVIEYPINTIETQKIADTDAQRNGHTTPAQSPLIIPDKGEELLATNPKVEKDKYVSASDLLFSAELDKSRKEQSSPNSKLGLNDINRRPKDPNNFSPKSLKILGITVYESDSLTQK